MSDNQGSLSAPGLIDESAYERAHAEIETITSLMPRKAVEALAREVVSRLAERAETTGNAKRKIVTKTPIEDAEIEDLAHDLLRPERDAALNRMKRLLEAGSSMDEVYLNHLAVAARLLGTWWVEDKVTFVEVTVGAGRIYSIMRALRSGVSFPDPEQRRHAIFASVPGEAHTLGVSMAADLFRKRGWQVDLQTGKEHDELVRELEDAQCILIGLSAGSRRAVTNTARLIVAIRIAVPGALVMISGNIVEEVPNLQSLVGADRAVSDFEDAYAAMESLLAQTNSGGADRTN